MNKSKKMHENTKTTNALIFVHVSEPQIVELNMNIAIRACPIRKKMRNIGIGFDNQKKSIWQIYPMIIKRIHVMNM